MPLVKARSENGKKLEYPRDLQTGSFAVFRGDPDRVSGIRAAQEIAEFLDEALRGETTTIEVQVPVGLDVSSLTWAQAVALSHISFNTRNPLGELYKGPIDHDIEETTD